MSRKYGTVVAVKTTLEIPDSIFRRAKASAAQQGIPLRQFVTEAVEEKLRRKPEGGEKPWMALAGKLQHLRADTARMNRMIEREFETIEPGEWE